MELHTISRLSKRTVPRPCRSRTIKAMWTTRGARIWYATFGADPTVIMLQGGLGHSGNWGYQVPALTSSGYRAVLIDSRGHGHSTRDERRYTYELMAFDVLAVMDHLQLEKQPLWAGATAHASLWSSPGMPPSGVQASSSLPPTSIPSGQKDVEPSPVLGPCFRRHTKDYAELSATPDQFAPFFDAVRQMQKTEPNYSVRDLADVHVPIAIVQGEHDEFIKLEHAEYLARSIPGAEFILLPGVSHFAPLQRPEKFNSVMRAFLRKLPS
jgi:pimeloyl-ACP methyl ester carboxylesterase